LEVSAVLDRPPSTAIDDKHLEGVACNAFGRQAESASTTAGRQTRKGAHKRLPSNMPESRIAALFVGQYLWTMVNNFSSHVFVRNSSD
jgi:hypothetical protein